MFGRMSIPSPRGEREKLITSLTPKLRGISKIRAFEHGMDIQDATEHAIKAWYAAPTVCRRSSTDGAKTWGTFLPVGGPDKFKASLLRSAASPTFRGSPRR